MGLSPAACGRIARRSHERSASQTSDGRELWSAHTRRSHASRAVVLQQPCLFALHPAHPARIGSSSPSNLVAMPSAPPRQSARQVAEERAAEERRKMVHTTHTPSAAPHSTHHPRAEPLTSLPSPSSITAQHVLLPARRPPPALVSPLPLRRRLHPLPHPRPHPLLHPQTPPSPSLPHPLLPPPPTPPPPLLLLPLLHPFPPPAPLLLLLLPSHPRVGLLHRPRQGLHLPRRRRAREGRPLPTGAGCAQALREDAGDQHHQDANRTGRHDRRGAQRSTTPP